MGVKSLILTLEHYVKNKDLPPYIFSNLRKAHNKGVGRQKEALF